MKECFSGTLNALPGGSVLRFINLGKRLRMVKSWTPILVLPLESPWESTGPSVRTIALRKKNLPAQGSPESSRGRGGSLLIFLTSSTPLCMLF